MKIVNKWPKAIISSMANKEKKFICHSANPKNPLMELIFAHFLFIPIGMLIKMISEFFGKAFFFENPYYSYLLFWCPKVGYFNLPGIFWANNMNITATQQIFFTIDLFQAFVWNILFWCPKVRYINLLHSEKKILF